MAKLTTKKRKKLSASVFGLPGERKYPIQDRAHAANAKARATQQVAKGNLSKGQEAKIDRKANEKLYGTPTMPKTDSKKRKTRRKASNDDRTIDRYVANY